MPLWSGTPEEYARLLKVAYLVIKQVDPAATVLWGGLAHFANGDFLPRLMAALQADPMAADAGASSTPRPAMPFFPQLPGAAIYRPESALLWPQRAGVRSPSEYRERRARLQRLPVPLAPARGSSPRSRPPTSGRMWPTPGWLAAGRF